MVSIRLPENLQQRLEAFALLHGHSKSFYIKEAISAYLDDMEDAHEAMERMKDAKAEYVSTETLLVSMKEKNA